jgi:hypothetical protein
MSLITLLGGHSDKEGAAARLLMASSERRLPKAAAELAALVAMPTMALVYLDYLPHADPARAA